VWKHTHLKKNHRKPSTTFLSCPADTQTHKPTRSHNLAGGGSNNYYCAKMNSLPLERLWRSVSASKRQFFNDVTNEIMKCVVNDSLQLTTDGVSEPQGQSFAKCYEFRRTNDWFDWPRVTDSERENVVKQVQWKAAMPPRDVVSHQVKRVMFRHYSTRSPQFGRSHTRPKYYTQAHAVSYKSAKPSEVRKLSVGASSIIGYVSQESLCVIDSHSSHCIVT